MKLKFQLRCLAAAALVVLAPLAANATVLTFDDIGTDGLVPQNYGGLD
ncbi:MAG: hypothetical protein JWP52_32, partial [Rhizobacter sp.]|nr:hypothetical protein [Rhizobacter sp.]